jgi:hypothetical protein
MFFIVKVKKGGNRDEVKKLVCEAVETKASANHTIYGSGSIFIVFVICRLSLLSILSIF